MAMNAVPAPRKPRSAAAAKLTEAARKKALKEAMRLCNAKYGRMLRRLGQ